MKLELIFESQSRLQNLLGNDFEKMDEKQRAAFIKENILWTIDELCEALHELPYAKSWTTKYDREDYDKEKHLELFKEEAIDALTFMLNLFLALGMTAEEVFGMYMEKNAINKARQTDTDLGYI